VTFIGGRCAVDGEIDSQEELTLGCRVSGAVWCEAHAVIVEREAVVTGDIIAREIVVRGTVMGDLIATRDVWIHASARVTGRIVAPALVLEEGGWFVGAVQPHRLTAALEVARHARRVPANERAARSRG
jgi:cytoskeletal protein CcmA (bactofilin family)